jgi:hypothetical protein
VPITKTKQGKFEINWKLIDKLVVYIQNRLTEMILPTDRHIVVEKYDLEEYAKKDRNKMKLKLWD